MPWGATPASARAEVSDVEVRRLYELEGWTAAEVAAQLGCGTSTVYARLQRLGVPGRPARPRRSSRPADTELRRLYLERGLSLRQLAERFSVSPQAVRGWLVAAGVPRRGQEGRTSPANSADMVVAVTAEAGRARKSPPAPAARRPPCTGAWRPPGWPAGAGVPPSTARG